MMIHTKNQSSMPNTSLQKSCYMFSVYKPLKNWSQRHNVNKHGRRTCILGDAIHSKYQGSRPFGFLKFSFQEYL